ncbi:MAG: DUF4861 domain-containing protein [Calditrichaceae bacterium]|nr:DUF4861 domain-containing protein [Calditrichaceae bacterium]MBN2710363.1 DUF4861 domain-containing protein [Calditrichaceae bacterium]RQV95112.1 MAG: DUF4861 domain-containing protein [Calditrichota bacterium]
MINRICWIFLVVFLVWMTSCTREHPLQKEFPSVIKMQISNPLMINRADEPVTIQIKSLTETKYPDFNAGAFVILDGDQEIASQVNDLDGDNEADEIVFICDLSAGETKICTLLYAAEGNNARTYTKRTQAEIAHKVNGKFVKREYIGGEFKNVDFLRVPPEHKDHSWFIRYEGPGWESDKVGYRFYLDWRNAVDIFGKKAPEMILQNVGLDGFDSYHEMSDWGMDVLKVGESLGIGSIAMWLNDKAERVAETDSVTCKIVINGPIQSKIRTNYHGWAIGGLKTDLTSCLTINAGSRLTKCDLRMSVMPENICTGIVKLDSSNIILSSDENSAWKYLATYGKQSLANDKLGMAVLFNNDDFIKLTADNHSHVVVLQPKNQRLNYYFLAAWEKEPAGISTEEQFVEYLKKTIEKLNVPVDVTIL